MLEQHLANLPLIMEQNNERGIQTLEAASQRQEERIGTLSLQPSNDFLSFFLLPVEFDWRLFEEILLFYHPVALSFAPLVYFYMQESHRPIKS